MYTFTCTYDPHVYMQVFKAVFISYPDQQAEKKNRIEIQCSILPPICWVSHFSYLR